MKKRYAVIGLGNRCRMFLEGIISQKESAEVVALCDQNQGRLKMMESWCVEKGVSPACYLHTDFEKMIIEAKVNIVCVSTMDSTHHEYICKAMLLGCDVVTEKPMTVDVPKCKEIFAVQKKTGRQIRVAFNYRYAPPRTQIKDLLQKKVIGDIISVDFSWMLNTVHGADYFRRWHRKKENSGGLLVHKSTHHFDLVNWWLNSAPKVVNARGARKFYTPERADSIGITQRNSRCTGCPSASKCPFYFDLSKADFHRQAYLECEKFDGYHRDQCIFSPDMDIEDHMLVHVEYDNGVLMNYSLNAFCGWEGYHIAFNGTEGRLEHRCMENIYVSGEGKDEGSTVESETYTRIYPIKSKPYEVDLWQGKGGHGGGDILLQEDLFGAEGGEDPFVLKANHFEGAKSIMTGIAANLSIAENREVNLKEFGISFS